MQRLQPSTLEHGHQAVRPAQIVVVVDPNMGQFANGGLEVLDRARIPAADFLRRHVVPTYNNRMATRASQVSGPEMPTQQTATV